LFGYALLDGTVGVYEGSTKLWNSKYSARVISIAAFDMDHDGTPELVVGLSDGTIEVCAN
jgi:Bardet-Biedl syndrome 2 protein